METTSSYGDNERLPGRDILLTTEGVLEYMARRFFITGFYSDNTSARGKLQRKARYQPMFFFHITLPLLIFFFTIRPS